jgi:putative phosphoesterase
MLLGVISDTHGHLRNTLEAIHQLETAKVDTVIHCGDIGSETIIQLFSPWPTHFVFGNVDQQEGELRAAMAAAGHHCHDRFGYLELEGKHVAFLHGDNAMKWQETVNSDRWDLVCYGHTHKAETRMIGRTMLLNPGAVFRATPHSVAIVKFPDLSVEFRNF